jgi:hypothetical protein
MSSACVHSPLPAASWTQKGWCPRSSCNWMSCFQHVNSGASYVFHVQWMCSSACMRQTCLRAGEGWGWRLIVYCMLVPSFFTCSPAAGLSGLQPERLLLLLRLGQQSDCCRPTCTDCKLLALLKTRAGVSLNSGWFLNSPDKYCVCCDKPSPAWQGHFVTVCTADGKSWNRPCCSLELALHAVGSREMQKSDQQQSACLPSLGLL